MKTVKKPRNARAWATMDPRTRRVTQIYIGESKKFVAANIFGDEVVVRVSVQPSS